MEGQFPGYVYLVPRGLLQRNPPRNIPKDNMRQLLVISSALLMAGSASAQALNEPFDTSVTGNFPPTGWTESNTGTPEIWVDTSAALLFAVPAGFAKSLLIHV